MYNILCLFKDNNNKGRKNAMRKLLLEADHISKIYDIDTKNPFIAMKDISLKVYEGDFICIMGPSGSGK